MPSLALVWDLIARDNASPAFARVGAAAERTAAQTEAATATVNRGMSTIVKAAGLAGVVFTAASAKMAADFQSSTTRLVTSANESQKNLKMVQQGMLDLAGAAGYGTDELAKAMYKVESGGQHGADALKTLKAAAQGAKTENADLTTVADALTSAMTDYHLKADQAATVTSKLVAATASGKMTFEELSGSLAAILPVASANHVALNDILGDLASMTMHGMSAEQASQNLADAIRHLAAPTQQQQKQFAALGLTTQQITADLGTKGLSGTINVITDAIKNQMGSSTTRVVLDLNTALSKLPPTVRKLGEGILDGSLSVAAYRKEVRGLPVEQAIAAQSFLALVSSTHQIGNETKNGAQVYQSYSGALRQALGDATGMNVALMIGGENAQNTATAISNVSKATAEAGGNVKGWSEIQGTFNQQASQTLHSLEAMTIEAGMHLLPALTSALGYVNRDGIPAIKGLASGAGDAVHWFSQLPAPVRDAAIAFAALKVASSIGFLSSGGSALLGGITGAFRATTTSVASLSGEMKLQQALFAAEARDAEVAAGGLASLNRALGGTAGAATAADAGLTRVQMQLRGYDVALAETVVAQDAANASLGRMGAAGATLAARGLSGARAAGAGLVSMLGGPWGVAILGAVAGIAGLNAVVERHDQQVKKATADVSTWYKTMALGAGDVDAAKQHIDDLRGKIADLQSRIDAYNTAAASGSARGGIGSLISQQADLRQELTRGQKAWDDYWKSLSPQQQAVQQVAVDEAALAKAIQQHGSASHEAQVAAARYNDDLERQKSLSGALAAAEQTQIDKINQLANAQLAAVSSTLADAQAQSSLADAVAQYNADATDGQHSTKQLADESNNLAQQAISAAQAAAQHAVDQAKANGVTDDGTIANKTLLDALKRSADQITGPGHDALMTAITDLEKTTIGSGTLADTVSKMGLAVAGTWDANTRVIKGATDQQIQDLKNLGLTVMTLPNGKVVVTADTGPARDQMQHLVDSYKNYSININPQGMALTTEQRNTLYSGGRAAGGPIFGPGTGTSDTAGLFALSNGEHVWTARETAAAGGHAGVAALRKAVLASGGGRAAGGPIEVVESARFSDAYMQAASALIARMGAMGKANTTFTGGGGGAGSPLIRALGKNIADAMGYGGQFPAIDYVFSHESGWNPNAQNPTSTAYGIPQFLNATWAAYGGKTSDPSRQIRDGIQYMRDRYGSPNGAAAFWQGHHWYDGGGMLMPGVTMAYNGTGKPETIRTAEQEAALTSGPMQITLQLDGRAVSDLLQGEIVTVLTGATDRGRNNPA